MVKLVLCKRWMIPYSAKLQYLNFFALIIFFELNDSLDVIFNEFT